MQIAPAGLACFHQGKVLVEVRVELVSDVASIRLLRLLEIGLSVGQVVLSGTIVGRMWELRMTLFRQRIYNRFVAMMHFLFCQ